MPPSRHSIAWLKEEPFGVEHVDVSLSANRLAATGVAIGSAPRRPTGSITGYSRAGASSHHDCA